MNEKRCTLLFLRRDNQILLAMKKRGFGADRYNGVGGKISPNETIEQALVRECQEEISVTPLNFTPVAEHKFYGGENDPFLMHVYVYFSTEWKGEPVESEEMAPEWFDITKIPYERMWSDDRLWLPLVLEGKKVKGEFSFDSDHQVTSHTVKTVDTLSFETETKAAS